MRRRHQGWWRSCWGGGLSFVCERRKWSQDAIDYNAMVLAWPDLKYLEDVQNIVILANGKIMDGKSFICPECGSHEAATACFVTTVYVKSDPWSGVLQRYECAGCGRTIPAHLAECWDGMSREEAARKWREVYRKQRGARR